jgi:pimeloyl-ACP methyl ester carboxylesterase
VRERIGAARGEVTVDDVPVVLVHGFASSYERNWREPGWADLLRDEDRQVIGVDLPGHGQAARPRDPAAYSSLEQSILTAMPGTGQVDAVGFSLGAQLLIRAAAAAPARFRRVAVAGIGDGVFASTDPEPAARAVESGRPDEAAGPVAAALACVPSGRSRTTGTGTAPAPAGEQPRQWNIVVVRTTTMEHRRGYGPRSRNRNADQAHHQHHPPPDPGTHSS